MKATIVQDIETEVGGYLERRHIVASIARCRQRIEERLGGGIIMPKPVTSLLEDICRELGLSQLELVESLGSTWATQKMWDALLPDLPSAQAEVEWVENQVSYQPRLVEL